MMKKTARQKTLPFIILPLVALLATRCAKDDCPSDKKPGKTEIFIRAAQETASFAPPEQESHSKTIIGGDNLDKVYWSELDAIRVYWRPAGSDDALNGQTFECFRPYPWGALFSTQMSDLEAGDYTYYAAYPAPESVDGTRATYTLPAVQDGTYDMRDYDIKDQTSHGAYKGNCDFMLARPVTAAALTAGSETLAMHFIHQCHVMRVQVPVGRNQWGERVSRLRVEFPAAVVGRMTMDLADPTAAPQLTEGGNTVIAELKNPLTESTEDNPDGNYVWLFLCPGNISGDVRFTAYDENGYQSGSLSVPIDRTLEAGRITPVTLTVPDELPVTWLDFSITGNNLGEEPNSFTVTAPDGATFRNGTNKQSFTVNAENKYMLGFYNEVDGRANGDLIRNGGLSFSYDSEHAIVTSHKAVDFTAEAHTEISLTVPYLFYEDFGGAGGSDRNNNTEDLGKYNLTGWSASRFGIQANTSAMIFGYLGSSIVTDPDKGDNHRGRIDTPHLTGLKEGANVSLLVSYDVGGTKKNGNTILNKTTVMYSKYDFGTDTKTGTIKGDGNAIENIFLTEEPGTNGSYTNLPVHRNITVTGCTNKHRLSWRASFRVDGQGVSTITAGDTYVYIDNIRGSIK